MSNAMTDAEMYGEQAVFFIESALYWASNERQRETPDMIDGRVTSAVCYTNLAAHFARLAVPALRDEEK